MNVDGYYNSLLSFIDQAVDEGFISPTARQIIVSAPTAKQLVRQLEVITSFISSRVIECGHHRNKHLALLIDFSG